MNKTTAIPDLFELVSEGLVNDTVFITAYYLQRPVVLQHQTIAQWFAAAHNITDLEFIHTAGSQAIKIAIVQKGYNKLPLAPLHTYNMQGEELNQRRRMK
jgi:hypothetical protein